MQSIKRGNIKLVSTHNILYVHNASILMSHNGEGCTCYTDTVLALIKIRCSKKTWMTEIENNFILKNSTIESLPRPPYLHFQLWLRNQSEIFA